MICQFKYLSLPSPTLLVIKPMPASTDSFYRITSEVSPPLLYGRVLRPMSVLEFTQAGEELLTEARRTQCPYWLLDGRADHSRQQPELYHWLEDDYLPRVWTVLGRPPVIAFLATPALWHQVQAQGAAAPDTTVFAAAYRVQWFTETLAAQTWLNQHRILNGPGAGSRAPVAQPL